MMPPYSVPFYYAPISDITPIKGIVAAAKECRSFTFWYELHPIFFAIKTACFLALIAFLYYAFVQQRIVTLTELSISYVIFVLPKLYSLALVNRTVTKAALIEVTHFREYLITEVERVWRKNFPIRRSISGVHRIYPKNRLNVSNLKNRF